MNESMAKQDLFDEAQEKGLVAEDADAGDYTVADLEGLLAGGGEGHSYTEAATVEETIENAAGIDPGNVSASAVVQSTTETVPREGDSTPIPNVVETEPAAPTSTQVPDEPIAQTLAAGAGEHTPPDPDEFDKEGRPRSVTGVEA